MINLVIDNIEKTHIKEDLFTIIREHNMVHEIEELFRTNTVASEYFVNSAGEACRMDNCNIYDIYYNAIRNMVDDIKTYNQENMILKSKLDNIMNILNGGKENEKR